MAKEITYSKSTDDKVVKILKQGLKTGATVEAIAALGVPNNQIYQHYLFRLDHVAHPENKVPATGKGVIAARAKGMRWEKIAWATGLAEKHGSLGAGIAAARQLMTDAGGDPDAYVGRGRRFDGSTKSKGSTGPARKTSGAKKTGGTSGRRGAAKKDGAAAKTAATSGRRGRGAAQKSAPAKPGRRGTRAGAGADPK